jgi:large subunit ribosomal protein L21
MYAIIRSGGKQYTVRAGDTLRVEKLPKELGSEFNLDEVLLVGGDKIHVGEPILKGATVTAVVTRQDRSAKVMVFKKKRRQGYRRTQGHRQSYTELFIKTITSPAGEVSEAEGKAVVVDPVKRMEREAKFAETQASQPKTAKKEAKEKKAAAKKAAPKKAAPKKAKAKKPAAKKAAAKKKTK